MASEVRETITDKIRESGFFGVIIDTTDDQYSISFQYVDMQTMNVEETFVEFVKVVGTSGTEYSGEELFTKLMQKFKEYGLKQNLFCAFSSDGAANMMGVNKRRSYSNSGRRCGELCRSSLLCTLSQSCSCLLSRHAIHVPIYPTCEHASCMSSSQLQKRERQLYVQPRKN